MNMQVGPDQTLDGAISTWIDRGSIKTSVISYESGRGIAALRFNDFTVDLLSRKMRMIGCAAIRVNRTLLIANEFRHQPLYGLLEAEARDAGWKILVLPTLTTLRSVLGGNGGVPSPKQWQMAVRSTVTKVFRRSPSLSAENIRALSRLSQLFEGGREAVLAARIHNAFVYQGEMTHVILVSGKTPKFGKFFKNAEDAMTHYLSHPAEGRSILDFSPC